MHLIYILIKLEDDCIRAEINYPITCTFNVRLLLKPFTQNWKTIMKTIFKLKCLPFFPFKNGISEYQFYTCCCFFLFMQMLFEILYLHAQKSIHTLSPLLCFYAYLKYYLFSHKRNKIFSGKLLIAIYFLPF